jgi:cobalt-zinc-cadmium efflux system membrane fusion protein
VKEQISEEILSGNLLQSEPTFRRSVVCLKVAAVNWIFLMKGKTLRIGLIALSSLLAMAGCHQSASDPKAGAPPPAKVVTAFDPVEFTVDRPEGYPLTAVVEHRAVAKLAVTGTVNPDIARTVPVISLASGRIVGIYARLGDVVKKGQLLLRLRSDDISGAFANYQMAVSDEVLAKAQWERAQDLLQHGAIAVSDLELAKDTEEKAKVAMDTAAEHLRLMGSDVNHPTGMVDITAPVAGVITDQEVTNAAGLQSLGTSPFTISDLSTVWIVCDVYENDLASVHVNDPAEITLNAYPGRVFKGTVSNILPILDPSIRTGKVRIEVANPGMMKVGMFVTATFLGRTEETYASVPAPAILHLHDRDWVYVPVAEKKFRRVMVVGGDLLPGNMQEIRSGISVGQQVVINPLVLQNTIDTQ